MVGGAQIVYHRTVSTGSIDIMTSEPQPTIAGETIPPIRTTDVEMESDFIRRLSPRQTLPIPGWHE